MVIPEKALLSHLWLTLRKTRQSWKSCSHEALFAPTHARAKEWKSYCFMAFKEPCAQAWMEYLLTEQRLVSTHEREYRLYRIHPRKSLNKWTAAAATTANQWGEGSDSQSYIILLKMSSFQEKMMRQRSTKVKLTRQDWIRYYKCAQRTTGSHV